MPTLSSGGKTDFSSVFKDATGADPFPYQRRLAESGSFPALLSVPTGLGKTRAIVLAWYWRRYLHPDPAVRQATPRRLVFCLPMRILVSQTVEVVRADFKRLAEHGYTTPQVAPMMGGQVEIDWQEHPEEGWVLIGTQDQLLSRALNRGYGMSRYAWPVHFAWLNNDCLWVLDETQLMGAALETTAQLAGLRDKLQTFGPSGTLWMSATLEPDDLKTADHDPARETPFGLDDTDRAHAVIATRLGASKRLERCPVELTKENAKAGAGAYAKAVARFAVDAHVEGTLTLIVVNRVRRAQQIYRELLRLQAGKPDTRLALVHARMRPMDRLQQEAVLHEPGDRIVVATQAIEAGVDVSSMTLISELAPWPSLVQRFGRCNRQGEGNGRVYWLNVGNEQDLALPYQAAELALAREQLITLTDVSPNSLAGITIKGTPPKPHAFRRRDLLDLFDTTADLLGDDLDVSRYIRDSDDTDVQFYWRELVDDRPDVRSRQPEGQELCTVRIGEARDFLKHARAWQWDIVEEAWLQVTNPRLIRPGQVLQLSMTAGGYDDQLGWTGDAKDVPSVFQGAKLPPFEGNGGIAEAYLGHRWVSLAEHTGDVVTAGRGVRASLEDDLKGAERAVPWDALDLVACRHDWGKAHAAFASKLGRPAEAEEGDTTIWAKSGSRPSLKALAVSDGEPRPGFRHELASALAHLACYGEAPDADLIAYLIASHHGKVRLSIRSAPNERAPEDVPFFARGVWHGDRLPPADLGPGGQMSEVELDLSLMSLGAGSWMERCLALRDEWGPFRLAYLEGLFRVADWRGSAKGAAHAPAQA